MTGEFARMRMLGDRNRLKGPRLALATVCVLFAVPTASASAATLYADPAGAAAGACTAVAPCELEYAVETAAAAGDEVRLADGTYAVASPIVAAGVTVRGAGPGRARLVGAVGLAGPTLTVAGGGTATHLRIESKNAQVALDLSGIGRDLEIDSTGGTAARVRGSSELNTTVVHTSAAGATALSLTDGLLTGASVYHATVLATGSGSTGLDASGLNVLGIGAPSVVSSIVSGVTTDVSGALLNSVSLTYSSFRSAASTGAISGVGSISAAPSLVDPAALNFQQQGAAPTVNTGSNPDGAAVDLAGNPRSIGSAPDMGALELPIPPDVSTGATTGVSGTQATIHGTVNPRASLTVYRFRWGTTNPPASSTADSTAGSADAGTAYSAAITGLKPGTTYYYRVSATNDWGTTDGPVASFDTPSIAPVAVTNAATLVAPTTARLNATVNPGGATTSAQIEWGTTTAYGSTSASQSLGTGANDVTLSHNLTGLLANTQYHYRVVSTNLNGTAIGADRTFTTLSRAPIVPAPTAAGVTTSAATLNGSIDPGGIVTTWKFEYGIGNYSSEVAGTDVNGSTPQAVSAPITGLLPGRTYDFRILADNVNGQYISAAGQFSTAVAAPTAATQAAGGIGALGATVAGTLNPGGGATTFHFEYGTTTAYGQSTAATGAGNGTDPVAVGAALSGLDPATEYHYRLVVENSAGTARGVDTVFTTAVALPDVSTGAATGITVDSAQVAATVNPGGAATTYEFEYGRTTAYGQTTAATTLPAGKTTATVTAALAGLESGAMYHYRVVARNSAGQRAGADRLLATEMAPASPTPPVDTTPDPDPDAEPPADDPAGEPPADGPVQSDGLPAPDPTPPVGKSANAAPASGTVRVRVPGASEFVELTEGAGIPVGSVVDATLGEVAITSASDTRGGTQTANFTGSAFKVLQRRAARPITDIVLTGGDLSDCTPRILTKVGDVMAAGRRKWSRRRLWGNGHGRFRTRGRHGTATVRGTWWLTEDRCDGTLVRVKRGLVEVRDLGLRKTVMVPAGESYLAKSPLAKKKRTKKTR
jgi:phosphodiesterase/alkaline phosphatase D-like protein